MEVTEEVKNAVADLQQAVNGRLDKVGAELKERGKQFDELDLKVQRMNLGGVGWGARGSDPSSAPEQWLDIKTRRPIPVLRHEHKLRDLDRGDADGAKVSVGRFLRGIALGGRADDAAELAEERKALGITPDTSGGYTVSGILASEWIDLLRSAMVLSQAGARTVPMDAGTVTLARLTADPTVRWHGENASLTEADPTFGARRRSGRNGCMPHQVQRRAGPGFNEPGPDPAKHARQCHGSGDRRGGLERRDDGRGGRAPRHLQHVGSEHGDRHRRADHLGLPGGRHVRAAGGQRADERHRRIHRPPCGVEKDAQAEDRPRQRQHPARRARRSGPPAEAVDDRGARSPAARPPRAWSRNGRTCSMGCASRSP